MKTSLLVRAALATLLLAPAVFGQTTSLSGAGGTFIYPLASKWFNEYNKVNPKIQINYQSIGSGGGIRQFSIEQTVDFGETDGPMNDQQLKDSKVQPVFHFPMALGGVVPVYNLSVTGLRFSGETLAEIFLGKVAMWDDPAIAKDNPGVKLPGEPITVVHRADGSGTTYTWVDFLSKVSPEFQKKVGVGTSVTWPVGLGGKGNDGVAGLVKQTPNSIGYVELVYAVQNKISYGEVRNSSGKFVKAGLASVSAAAAGAVKNMPADFRVSITDAPNAEAYPISTFTWMLIPRNMNDKNKAAVLKDFLKWSLTTGQNECEALTYAKLPKEVVTKEAVAIGTLQY